MSAESFAGLLHRLGDGLRKGLILNQEPCKLLHLSRLQREIQKPLNDLTDAEDS